MQNGKVSNKVTPSGVIVRLTPGTGIVVRLSGKLKGTINGMPVSGAGHLEYIFNYGDAAWTLEAEGLASGPQIPAGELKFVPAGSSGSLDFSTTGVVEETTPGGGYSSKKDRYNWPLKGRSASISISTADATVSCFDAAALCVASEGDPAYCVNFTGECFTECEQYLALSPCL